MLLSGFLFLPNGVLSAAALAVGVLHLGDFRRFIAERVGLGLLLALPMVAVVSWAVAGFAHDGWREVRLWPMLFLVALAFAHSVQAHGYLAIWSVVQVVATVVSALLVDSDGLPWHQIPRHALHSYWGVHATIAGAGWGWAAFYTWLQKPFGQVKSWVVALVLVVGVAAAGGKMPFAALAAAVVLRVLSQRYPFKTLLVGSAVAAAVVAAVVWLSPLRSRFSELLTMGEWTGTLSSVQLRAGVWQCVVQLIDESWLLGYGIGHTRAVLEVCYAGYGNVQFFQDEFNSHNQFAHYWLGAGVIGLLVSAGGLAAMLMRARRRDHAPLFFGVVYIGLLMLTENLLLRQHGMVLYGFCVGLWVVQGAESSTLKEETDG